MITDAHLGRWLDLTAHLLTLPPDEDPMVLVCSELTDCFGGIATGTVDLRADLAQLGRYRSRQIELDFYAQHLTQHPVTRHYLETGDTRACALEDSRRFFGDRDTQAVLSRGREDGMRDFAYLPLTPLPGMSHRWVGMALETAGLGFQVRDLFDRMSGLLRAIDCHGRVLAAWLSAGCRTTAARDLGVTSRELAVLALIARGLTADAIGRRLCISTRTVRKHQENLYRKLCVGDRLTAVLVAQREGLLPNRWMPAVPSRHVEIVAARI